MNPFDRTHETELTDDELLLLDFLFDKLGATLRSLSQADYSIHMNCRYTHGLDDQRLAGVMRDLTQRGIVESFVLENRRDGFALTPLGGELWERERHPDWRRHCEASYDFDDEQLTVLSTDREIGLAFWRTAQDCRMYDISTDPTVTFLSASRELVYWRTFDVWQISAPAKDFDDERMLDTDWQSYRRARTWWRSLSELLEDSGLPPSE